MIVILMVLVVPLLGLLVVRLNGPVRPGQAFAAAVTGQIIAYGAFWVWRPLVIAAILKLYRSDIAIAWRADAPSAAERLAAIAILSVIACAVAAVFLGV